MKDLFKTKVHKGDVGYYILQMSDLGYQDPDKKMKARWRGLKNSTKVWNDSSTVEEFERGLLHLQLARELYTLPLIGLASLSYQGDGLGKFLTFQELDALKSGGVWRRSLRPRSALENARAELPRQAVHRYKESVGFKEGLKRMGRVTYEYGYRVALARFHALHPDSEVEEDPFNIHPEDDLVPMER
ncbi:hypothetical protein B296_00038241 [Ensete ventricosum]|uniref:Uncharacterized protein n=1 Tax=Ensete ventricosum TaxID=4639 RepID=A0A426X052_ENSVE|nr:hypothetical protein B296_00038241 [Ensete ventricosum]